MDIQVIVDTLDIQEQQAIVALRAIVDTQDTLVIQV